MAGLFGTRAQVRPLSQTAIQPTGIPGSTFIRPQQREAGGNASALATALGSLNSALQNFGAVKAAQQEDPQARANREWIARRQQMSADQLRQEAANGTTDGIRVREDALNAMLGERANDDFRQKWMEFYNTEFDRTSGNAAAEYERIRQEFAEGLPTEIARGNFYRLTKDHFSAWMEKDTEEKVGQVKQELNTTIVDSFRNSIDDAVSIHGRTAQEAAAIVFRKSAANRDFLGLSGQEQNETIFRVAEEYALKGEEEVARALLEGDRTGADGRAIPSLVKVAGYTDKAIRLMDQASDMRRKKSREQGLEAFIEDDTLVAQGAFTDAEANKRRNSGLYSEPELANMVRLSTNNRLTAEAKWKAAQSQRAVRAASEQEEDRVFAQAFGVMSRMGGINKLRDIEIVSPSGEGTKIISRQQQIDAVIDMKERGFEAMQEELVNGGTDPEAARAQVNRVRVDWYAGNKLDNKAWINTLNGIAGRATMDTLRQGGEVSAYLKDSAKLYRDLKAVNPAYLSTLLQDASSKEFLEAYDNAVSNRRMTDDDALLFAAHVTSQPVNLKARSMMSQPDAERLAVRTLRDLGLDDRAWNRLPIMARIASMSSNGATEREIKDALEADILDTAVPINGVLVPDHRDLPDDFPELMQLELTKRFPEIAKRYGIRDANDLFIFPDGAESRWYIGSKSHGGMPLSSVPITPKSLEAHREQRRAEQEELVRKLAQTRDAERAELKRQYDAEIAEERKRIEFWSKASSTRQGLRKTVAAGVAERLQHNLDERLAADGERINFTPAERAEKRNRKLRKEAEENARSLGFTDDMIRD